jgi:electron transfer flavoprotein beta subunit
MQIEVTDAGLKLKRELEAGWFQWVELPLPAVLTIQSGCNKPRYATLKGIMAAKKKEIVSVPRESLNVPDSRTQEVLRIYVPQKAKQTEFIAGSPKEIAAKLLEKLRHEARVL